MPLILCVAAGQSANTYTQNYGITTETETLNLQLFYSIKAFPDGVNKNAYNIF